MVHQVIGADPQWEYVAPWNLIISNLWISHFRQPIDEFPGHSKLLSDFLKPTILDRPYNDVLDFLQAMLREISNKSEPAGLRAISRYAMPHQNHEVKLSDEISALLKKHQMAYYLDTDGPPTFIPLSSPQEGKAIRDAMKALAESDAGMDGAQAHLRKAADNINQGEFAGAIRESISAVESAAKVISADAKIALAPALDKLQGQRLLSHSALKDAFVKLYGYTSDEKGIRHALLDKAEANVDQEEALFMFGACASFCGYLCRKRAKIQDTGVAKP